MGLWITFFLGVAFAEISRRVSQHVAPRRGAPSPATALRLLHERERALTLREREWINWAIYVSGLTEAAKIPLPPMPGSAGATRRSAE